MSLARWGPCSVTALKDPRTKLEASAPESPLQLEKQLPDYDISASIFTIEMQVLVDSDIIIMQADIRLFAFYFINRYSAHERTYRSDGNSRRLW